MKRLIGKVFPNDMSPLVGILELLPDETSMNSTNLPQNVHTARYISNILNRGRNDDFNLINLTYEQATHDGIVIGGYYDVIIEKPMPDHTSERASGVTPHQAVQRALIKFGVTFR